MFFVERYSKRKLPALCQLAMEALGIQRFSLHSHHAAHGSFASGALSSVTAKVCGVQKFPEASLEATSCKKQSLESLEQANIFHHHSRIYTE